MSGRELIWRHERSGLEAVVVIDDTTLGPAAGGTRTRAYPTLEDAREDARALARAMTLKCALGGLDAGGCKIVVREHPGMDRPAVFAELGRRIQELAGEVHTSGDFGTTIADLRHMASQTEWVHLEVAGLARSTARGLAACLEACVRQRGARLKGLRVAVQGCGGIGAAVAAELAARGASLLVADLDAGRVAKVVADVGAEVVAPDDVLGADVDMLAPCAIGGLLDRAAAEKMLAWAVAPAANNTLRSREVARVLSARGILLIPDVVSSAGAVVDGIGAVVMGLDDRTALLDRLGEVAAELLARSERDGITTVEAAEHMAAERLGKTLRLT